MSTPTIQNSRLTLDQAENLAHELMKQHGLLEDGWRFCWSNAKRQLGRASIRKRRVSRSRPPIEIKMPC